MLEWALGSLLPLFSSPPVAEEAGGERLMAWGWSKKEEKKEPCKKEACNIQACLTKNNFDSQRCLREIVQLQSCCEKCGYNSTHCASLSGLLKMKTK